jgi:hypothetical protein
LSGSTCGRLPDRNAGHPVVYGWIGASHPLGASLAACGAGAFRIECGDCRPPFLMAGVPWRLAGTSFLAVS